MSRRPEGGESGGSTRAREHLANERTLLAWVRTAWEEQEESGV